MRMPSRYVVDASVVVKWFSKFEDDVEYAEKLLNTTLREAPHL